MPIRLLVIGLLFCLGGIASIVDFICDLRYHGLSVNLGICLLPVGIGLLKGKSSSRGWAKVWIIFGYLVCAILMIAVMAKPDSAYASFLSESVRGPAAVPYVVVIDLVFVGFLYLMQRALYSDIVSAYIERMALRRHELEMDKDDTSLETTCLECGRIIAAGTTRCTSCGWSYKLDPGTDSSQ